MSKAPFPPLAAALLLSCICGCSYVNRPLNDADVPVEARKRNDTRAATFSEVDVVSGASTAPVIGGPERSRPIRDRDGYFVGIAISGGGLRSSNFAAGCLLQLERIGLLQRADYMSSVSGGSLTAAYYCAASDRQWNPGDIQRNLTHRFATDMICTVLQPWNAIALMSTDYDTSDVLAKHLDRVLYQRDGRSLTFADLREDRPRLLINATDLQSGKRFVFCNETFDEINSDLAAFPIAHAVAASGAFPVAIHDKTLRDFSTAFKQYRHLIDGGVTDNLGIFSLVEVYEAQNRPQRAGGPIPYPNGAVLIVIDAGTQYDAKLSNKSDISFIEEVQYGAGRTSTELINRTNAAALSNLILMHSSDDYTAAQLREHKARLEETGHMSIRDRSGRNVEVVHISLLNLRKLSDLPFSSFGESVDSIATYYNIDETEAYRLYQAAELLTRTPEMRQTFRRLVEELDAGGAERRARTRPSTSPAAGPRTRPAE